MDVSADPFPAVHLRLKLKRNEKLKSIKEINNKDPFFATIDGTYKAIVEKCKNRKIEEYIFPYVGGEDEFREVNYRPFGNAIILTETTVLSEDEAANYIIDNINTDWALSAIERLTNTYKTVTIYRLYTHMPFKLKFVISCEERMNDFTGPINESIMNKINSDSIYRFVRQAQDWTLSMIWAAETGENTFYSSDIIHMYFKLMHDLLDDL